jgi:hypothetical protein
MNGTTKMTQKQSKSNQERSADEIFTAATTEKRKPYFSEDTGQLYIRRLSAPEARTMFDSMSRNAEGDIDDPYDDARVIQVCVCDSEGQAKFQPGALPKIAAMAHNVIIPLVNACLDYNAMSKRGIEELRKNSGATPGSSSA